MATLWNKTGGFLCCRNSYYYSVGLDPYYSFENRIMFVFIFHLLHLLVFAVAQNLQQIIMQQIQDLQKGKGVLPEQPGKRPPFQKGPIGTPPFGSSQGNSPPNHNLMKNAQQTALTLLLASQMQQNGSSGQMSPTSSSNMTLQNQQLLAALQAMSKGGGGDQFLNGIPGLNAGPPPNLTNLLGLGNQSNGMSPLSSPQGLDHGPHNMGHPFYQSQGNLLSPGGSSSKSCMGDEWSSFKSSNRSTPVFGSNGMHKVLFLLFTFIVTQGPMFMAAS